MTLHELPSSYRDRAIASSAYGPWPGFKFEYATALALRTAWCLGPDSYSRLYYGALSRDILLVVFSQQVRLCRAFPLLRQASAKWRDCTLAGDLVLLDAQGRALQTWRDDQVAGCSREGQPVWLEVKVTARPCSDCKLKFQPQEPEAGSLEACVSITLGQPEGQDAGQSSGGFRAAGHMASRLTGHVRRLLGDSGWSGDCAGTGNIITGYARCVQVWGTGRNEPPHPGPAKHWIHWTLEEEGASFAVELDPYDSIKDYDGQVSIPGWVGIGWSPYGPADHPPQMINATAVMAWWNENDEPVVKLFNLYSKSIVDIQESYDQFIIANQSLELISERHLVLRFWRRYDYMFQHNRIQRMITAHNHNYRALMEHNHRAAIVMDLADGGTIRVVEPRLDVVRVQAHAWLMFAAFGLILPWGVIWARYFKDFMGRWYLVHIAVQALGLLVGLAGFLIAVTQFNPIPTNLAHFQLGVAVMVLALLQPLNSLPRLTMHHRDVMRSVYWAWLHWLIGRATLVFGFVNIFLGFGRYRTWFNLGSWPEGAFGLYLGAIVLLCTIMESRLSDRAKARAQDENDHLIKRMTELEARGSDSGNNNNNDTDKRLHQQEEDHDEFMDQDGLTNTASNAFLLPDRDVFVEDTSQAGLDQAGLRDFDSSTDAGRGSGLSFWSKMGGTNNP